MDVGLLTVLVCVCLQKHMQVGRSQNHPTTGGQLFSRPRPASARPPLYNGFVQNGLQQQYQNNSGMAAEYSEESGVLDARPTSAVLPQPTSLTHRQLGGGATG